MENGNARPRRFVRVAAPLVAAAAIGAGVAVAVDRPRRQPQIASPAGVDLQHRNAAASRNAAPPSRDLRRGVRRRRRARRQLSAAATPVRPAARPRARARASSSTSRATSPRTPTSSRERARSPSSSTTARLPRDTRRRDPSTDVAVVKVNVSASKLKPLTLGDSSDVEPGQGVVAIGSPSGSTARSPPASSARSTGRFRRQTDRLASAASIQTDAAINKGNSGGPLLNARAR